MPSSQYLAQKKLGWFRGTAPEFAYPASIGNLYISIHNANPGVNGSDGNVTTAVAGGRGTLSSANLSSPTPSSLPGGGFQISNTQAIVMTISAESAQTLTHFGVWDSLTGGNFLCYGSLAQPVSVQVADVVRFAIGQMIIREI